MDVCLDVCVAMCVDVCVAVCLDVCVVVCLDVWVSRCLCGCVSRYLCGCMYSVMSWRRKGRGAMTKTWTASVDSTPSLVGTRSPP